MAEPSTTTPVEAATPEPDRLLGLGVLVVVLVGAVPVAGGVLEALLVLLGLGALLLLARPSRRRLPEPVG